MSGAGPRRIVHADMDAFFAAIECRDRPELRGRPVVVGGLGPRGVVATASYEARRYGIHSAMPTAEARPRRYAAVAAELRAVFAAFTPVFEPLSLDEAFLDLSGTEQLLGDAVRAARRLKEAIREAVGLPVSIGVATNKFVAKVASDLDKPDGFVAVPPGTEQAFLAPLPVERLWGAGPATVARLHARGIQRIGDLQRLGPEDAAALLGGALGARLHALALGIDPRPVEARRRPKSIGAERTFPVDLSGIDAQLAVLLRLCEKVGRRLRAQGLAAGGLRLKLRFPPFETHTKECRLEPPTQDDAVLFRTARKLLRTEGAGGRAVRLLGVSALRLAPAARHGLFPGDPERVRRLLAAADRIRARHGEDAIHRGGPAAAGGGP